LTIKIVIEVDYINKPYTTDDIKKTTTWSELGRMINGWEVTEVTGTTSDEASEEQEEEENE
jgi:hypothetical protein